MAVSADQLSVALETLQPLQDSSARREPRENTVRIVEYTPFPRVASHEHPRIGFTRDLSRHGMCLGVDGPEDVGAMLRVTIRDVMGQPERPGVARVAWCSDERDGRHWLGLESIGRTEPS